MLFSKKIEPRCEYCRSAVPFDDEDVVGCKHRGVMRISDKCRRFTYDPLKRVPRTLPPLPKLSEEDLLL